MPNAKQPLRIAIGLYDVFYAIAVFRALAKNLEQGFGDIEYLENDKKLSLKAFDETIDSLIILLLQYLSDEEDRALAKFLNERYGIKFEEDSVVDTDGSMLRKEAACEPFISVWRTWLYDTIGKLIIYGHPSIEEELEDHFSLSIESARKYFGGNVQQPVVEALMKLIAKKRHRACEQFAEAHSEISVDVWQ